MKPDEFAARVDLIIKHNIQENTDELVMIDDLINQLSHIKQRVQEARSMNSIGFTEGG